VRPAELWVVLAIVAVSIVGCQPFTDPEPSLGRLGSPEIADATSNRVLGFMQDFVQIPDHADLDLQHQWTLEAWVYPRAVGNGADEDLIAKWNGAGNASYILQIDGAAGTIRLVTHDGVANTITLSQTALRNRVWQHRSLRRSGSC
jgi:hypothetical protein